jgi:hypothetical protein
MVEPDVTAYLTKDANAATLRQVAELALGSTLAMTFLLSTELVDDADRAGLQIARTAPEQPEYRSSAFYTPDEMLALARDAGFNGTRYVAGASFAELYFANRTDGLRLSSGEDLLLATI